MNDLRILIQARLDLIDDIECGPAKPDGMVESGQTYFGYELAENAVGSDYDRNYAMGIQLTGRLVRKDDPTENTLQIIDGALEKIKEALKELNFRYSYRDVSEFQDGFRKIAVSAEARYDELNKGII